MQGARKRPREVHLRLGPNNSLCALNNLFALPVGTKALRRNLPTIQHFGHCSRGVATPMGAKTMEHAQTTGPGLRLLGLSSLAGTARLTSVPANNAGTDPMIELPLKTAAKAYALLADEARPVDATPTGQRRRHIWQASFSAVGGGRGRPRAWARSRKPGLNWSRPMARDPIALQGSALHSRARFYYQAGLASLRRRSQSGASCCQKAADQLKPWTGSTVIFLGPDYLIGQKRLLLGRPETGGCSRPGSAAGGGGGGGGGGGNPRARAGR